MERQKTFFIRTFGCQQNVADSERIVTYYRARGFKCVLTDTGADIIVINSCMIREKAEERVYGYIRNIGKNHQKAGTQSPHIVLTGCIVGAAAREPSGKMAQKLKKRIPHVELMPIEEVGFEYLPERAKNDAKHAWVVISHGCNNYCAFCIVPFSRGKEISRPFDDIITEVKNLAKDGYTSITLLGQNVNSYGSDFLLKQKQSEDKSNYILPNGESVKPVWVSHLGRSRIPTLFPHLLESVAHVNGIEKITFTSSNPWDFSDELIDVIAGNKNIDRQLHLPVQSGSTKILKKMNRWYTREEYIALINKIKKRIPETQFITDIIVGFPGETEEDFQDTLDLAKQVGFVKVFAACYSPRPGTTATKNMEDVISWEEKKRRFHIVNEKINLAHRGATDQQDWIATREKHRIK